MGKRPLPSSAASHLAQDGHHVVLLHVGAGDHGVGRRHVLGLGKWGDGDGRANEGREGGREGGHLPGCSTMWGHLGVVLVVVDLERLLADHGLERVVGVGQRGELHTLSEWRGKGVSGEFEEEFAALTSLLPCAARCRLRRLCARP